MTVPLLDYGNLLMPRLEGRGLDPDRLRGDLARRFDDALAELHRVREAGDLGFLDLPDDRSALASVRELADDVGGRFDDIVVLGIGGSGLGTVTLRDALVPPGTTPRIHVLDNPDPATVSALLGRLDLRRTLFDVVSKSGSTAETMALYLVVRGRLVEAVGADHIPWHLVFTTDPERGSLRRIADAEGIPTLAVPPNVGGRFSVLSPVGLFPAACAGVDVEALLRGAGTMAERCLRPELTENPAGLLAVLLHAADTELSAPIHVLMPYADRLRSLALWFQQLWAESLGKARSREGDVVEVGPTPLPAVGATDQHAQVQLFMEGPRDKVVLFVTVADPGGDVQIPDIHPEEDGFSYLAGHSLGALLDAERRATTEALRREGRPSMTLEIGAVDPPALGGLFMLFQIATVLAGALYGIDPLVQPGVEAGKRLTYGLLGRKGHEAPDLRHEDPRWRV